MFQHATQYYNVSLALEAISRKVTGSSASAMVWL
jgi:hypothetical protein